MSDHGAPDPSWIQWALSSIGGAAVTGFGMSRWISSAVEKARSEALTELATVKREGEAERDAIWERLNRHIEEDERIHRDAERHFASKDDIRRLEARITDESARIIEAIGARGPIRDRH